MGDSEKIAAVYDYLKAEFESCSITDSYNGERKARVFRVESANSRHTALVEDVFFERNTAQSIPETLRKFLLAEHLRECNFPIVVTANGLTD